MLDLKPNKGKNLIVEFNGSRYARFPVKTKVINKEDKIVNICKDYLKSYLQSTDLVFISEKIVAITQDRAFSIAEIKPSWLAHFLVQFVRKSPYGIGLGSPWTMELAIREAGIPLILLAAVVSALTKPFGIKGMFYIVAGHDLNTIDGPCRSNVPPYNHYAILGPLGADRVTKQIKKQLNNKDVVIIDANDFGLRVLGRSSNNITDSFCHKIFKDNPMGQSREQTPLCIVRKVM